MSYDIKNDPIRAVISPCQKPGKLSLLTGGPVSPCRARAIVSRLPEDIGRRECRTILRKLNWQAGCFTVEKVRNSAGPGNVVFAERQRGGVNELFTGFGRLGVPAERVGEEVVRQVRRYLKSEALLGN